MAGVGNGRSDGRSSAEPVRPLTLLHTAHRIRNASTVVERGSALLGSPGAKIWEVRRCSRSNEANYVHAPEESNHDWR